MDEKQETRLMKNIKTYEMRLKQLQKDHETMFQNGLIQDSLKRKYQISQNELLLKEMRQVRLVLENEKEKFNILINKRSNTSNIKFV